MTNQVNKIQLPATILLASITGGGKTHYCKNTLLPALKGQYDVLVICSPTLNVNGDYDFIEADDKKVFKVQHNITEAIEEMIQSQIKLFDMKQLKLIKHEQIPRILVICDDCLNQRLFEGERSVMSKFGIKARHYKMSFIIMTQRLNGIPRQLRLNSKYLICFTVADYSEFERICINYFPKKYQKQFQEKMIEIFQVPFNYLFINNQERDISKRIYINGEQLIEFNSME